MHCVCLSDYLPLQSDNEEGRAEEILAASEDRGGLVAKDILVHVCV